MKIKINFINGYRIKHFIKQSTLSYFNHGWGNGYVCLPPGHPCFGMNYDDIHDKYDIEVHGGLTFSEYSFELKGWSEVPKGIWWIVGFDTAHYKDNLTNWPKEKVYIETCALAEQLNTVQTSWFKDTYLVYYHYFTVSAILLKRFYLNLTKTKKL